MGLKDYKNFKGFLNLDIKINKKIIIKPISKIKNYKQLEKFVYNLIKEYTKNSKETLPNSLIMPSKDYYGFKNSSIKIKTEDLENEFKKIVGKDFKVLDLIYSNKEENEKYGINTNRYVLYRYSKDNLEIKVDYLILSNPDYFLDYFNDFETSQIMFGRFGSIIIEKPEPIIYFDYYDMILLVIE